VPNSLSKEFLVCICKLGVFPFLIFEVQIRTPSVTKTGLVKLTEINFGFSMMQINGSAAMTCSASDVNWVDGK
jgi:hypothetical protein